jgi:hypothetical protein
MADLLEFGWLLFDRDLRRRYVWRLDSLIWIFHRPRRVCPSRTCRHIVASSIIPRSALRGILRRFCAANRLPDCSEEDWLSTSSHSCPCWYTRRRSSRGNRDAAARRSHRHPGILARVSVRCAEKALIERLATLHGDAKNGGAGDGIILEGIERAVGIL